jgi:3-deoxy-D-manno-octulosonic acid kinase
MTNGGQWIATPAGAMLADPNCLGNAPGDTPASMFDPAAWAERGAVTSVAGGRGAAWFVGGGDQQWVLRHYRRGGWAARVSRDRYAWLGESRVRAFAEWRLLQALSQRGLPVAQPIAAGYERSGLTYRCDLITRRIPEARPLSAWLAGLPLEESTWRAIGASIAKLHQAGAYHADLNAHNILLDARGAVTVIDFDRGALRSRGRWMSENLARLQRSLRKISAALPEARYSARTWEWLLSGYRSVGP